MEFEQYDFQYPSCDAFYNLGGLMSGMQIGDPWDTSFLAGGGIQNCPGNANEQVVNTKIQAYACPSDKDPGVITGAPLAYEITVYGWDFTFFNSSFVCTNARQANYLLCVYDREYEARHYTNLFTQTSFGKRGVFSNNRSARMREIRDGLSTTIAVGETKQDHIAASNQPVRLNADPVDDVYDWGEVEGLPCWGAGTSGGVYGAMIYDTRDLPLNLPAGEQPGWFMDPADPNARKLLGGQFGSVHLRGAYFLFADGAVHFLRDNLPMPVFKAMGTINQSGGSSEPSNLTIPE